MNKHLVFLTLFIILFGLSNISCQRTIPKFYGMRGPDSINLDLGHVVNYHLFENCIVFTSTREPIKRKHYKNYEPVTYLIYSFNLITQRTDSISFLSPYYLTINSKLNDSLFVIGYYDYSTALMLNDLKKSNTHFRDTTVTLIEHYKVFDKSLKIIDSTKTEYLTTKKECLPLIDYIEYAKERYELGKSLGGTSYYNFPFIARSYTELTDRYKIIFKYNKFWCRHTQTTNKRISSGEILINDLPAETQDTILNMSTYWNILFDTENAFAYQFSNPAHRLKNSEEYLPEERKEILSYYWNKDIVYRDTLNGKTDYLVYAGYKQKELIIGRKMNSDQLLEQEADECLRIDFETGNPDVSKLQIEKFTPTGIIPVSRGRYLINGLHLNGISNDSDSLYLNNFRLTSFTNIEIDNNNNSRSRINNQSIAFSPKLLGKIKGNGLMLLHANTEILEFDAVWINRIVNISHNNNYILIQVDNNDGEKFPDSKFYFMKL